MLTPDGKILASGGAQSNGFLYRFNSDGTRDTTFESPVLNSTVFQSSTINDFDVQANGSIVFVGYFLSVNGVDRVGIAKLLPAGNVDLSFVPTNVFGINGSGNQVKALSNGQIIVSANNSTLYRLNANGSVDSTFTPPANLSGRSIFCS